MKTKREYKKRPLSILMLPGMGDIYWVMIFLQDFLKQKQIEDPPDVYIWNFDERPRSLEYVEKIPFVRAAGYYNAPITDDNRKIFNITYHSGEYSVVKDFEGFDYYISVNGYTRQGGCLDDEDMAYKTDWYFPMFESLEEKQYGIEFKKKHKDYILCYFSDSGMFQSWVKKWPPKRIADMLLQVWKQSGCKLVFSGLSWDNKFLIEVQENLPKKAYINTAGTTLDEFFGMLKQANGMIGWCGGNTIMSTRFKVPTIIIWDEYFDDNGFAENCCPPNSLGKWYFPLWTHTATVSGIKKIVKKYFKKGV
jgi:hypothetical protein